MTIYIQHESPGKDREANWLPAPDGPLWMAMRIYLRFTARFYGPYAPLTNGSYNMPKAEKVR